MLISRDSICGPLSGIDEMRSRAPPSVPVSALAARGPLGASFTGAGAARAPLGASFAGAGAARAPLGPSLATTGTAATAAPLGRVTGALPGVDAAGGAAGAGAATSPFGP